MKHTLVALIFILPTALPAQEYDVPRDYLGIEASLDANITACLQNSRSYQGDLRCGTALYDICTSIAPDGDTTAGLAICGGVISNVLDRQMNVIWRELRRGMSPDPFQDLLEEQRNWLAFRKSETRAAAQRNSGGSMGAYTGWLRYVDMSSERVARLREIFRG